MVDVSSTPSTWASDCFSIHLVGFSSQPFQYWKKGTLQMKFAINTTFLNDVLEKRGSIGLCISAESKRERFITSDDMLKMCFEGHLFTYGASNETLENELKQGLTPRKIARKSTLTPDTMNEYLCLRYVCNNQVQCNFYLLKQVATTLSEKEYTLKYLHTHTFAGVL